MMDIREDYAVEEKEKHLIEVVTHADYAGNRNDRKSTTSFQIFIDENLMESRLRTQKAISLSSGESDLWQWSGNGGWMLRRSFAPPPMDEDGWRRLPHEGQIRQLGSKSNGATSRNWESSQILTQLSCSTKGDGQGVDGGGYPN